MSKYDIPALERALENVENNDAEAHKLYNNLGLAHFANRRFRQSLKAHREEKRACKRLVTSSDPPNVTHLLDLAMAYRRCGEAMLKLDRLVDARQVVIDDRAKVIRAANEQHRKGVEIVRNVKDGGISARVELQASCAAVAHSALALALETKDRGHFEAAAFCCVEAAVIAESLPEGEGGVSSKQREGMLMGISVNMGIAMSGLGERQKAKNLLTTIAVKAKKNNDDYHLVRAIANLAEEASEEGDLELSERYSREWIRLAKKLKDEDDEADALRKLGVVLNDRGRLEEAKQALERALLLSSTKHGQAEARRFLNVVEEHLEDRESAKRELEELEGKGGILEIEKKVVEEAKVRMEAGNIAFKLGKMEDVVRLLGRYFNLVDKYGCDTSATGIDQSLHNSAVANMGEAMWSLKRFGEAVKWASKELTLFTADIPGQAQAWCNLGVYLDDFGKRENAVEALKTSMELAEKSGENDTLQRARTNLELVRQALQEKKAKEANEEKNHHGSDAIMEDVDAADNDEIESVDVRNGLSETNHDPMYPSVTTPEVSGERSVIIDSSQPMRMVKNQVLGGATQHSQGISSRRSRFERTNARGSATSKALPPNHSHSLSHQSRAATAGTHSSAGSKKFLDLVAEYKSVCTKRLHPPVVTRAMVETAFRTLSSTLLAREACGESSKEPAKLDVSALFLNNYDVSVIFETLSRLNHEYYISLDMRLNPMVTRAAYECLNPKAFTAPAALHALRSLDFSCAGVSAGALKTISDALSEDGSLVNVTYLNLSKNDLGKQCRETATYVARLLYRAARLEVVDLSLNVLPERFMQDLIDAVEVTWKTMSKDDLGQSPVRAIDLHLNNRKSPTALLEGENIGEAVKCFRKLFEMMPGLESVDVRACGANTDMRRALRDFSAELPGFSRNVITVSADIHDDLSG